MSREMARRSASATAAQVWRLMMECSMQQFGRTSGVLQELGLTPGHMKALLMLEPGEPRPMGSLAQQFAHLDPVGLVERPAAALLRGPVLDVVAPGLLRLE